MYDEQTAKTKWCPMVRDGGGMRTARKRFNGRIEYSCCIASDCMMWRWTVSPSQVRHGKVLGNEQMIAVGYCGLAG